MNKFDLISNDESAQYWKSGNRLMLISNMGNSHLCNAVSFLVKINKDRQKLDELWKELLRRNLNLDEKTPQSFSYRFENMKKFVNRRRKNANLDS